MTRSPIFAHAADLYREMRREFDIELEAAYAEAEEGTGGAMLNKVGRSAPVDAYSLLTGPWSRVLKYGSPELIEWFENHGRPSISAFERDWFAGRYEEETGPWLGPWLPESDEPTSGGTDAFDPSGTLRISRGA